ncbi:MAG: hypothetical protein K2P94_03140 [Rhodospirillaceae bacterium]|nr:hypothetical protein [Rhodospirillaceae bacterium]
MRFLSFTSRRLISARDAIILAANTAAPRKPLKATRDARRCARRKSIRTTPGFLVRDFETLPGAH